MAWLSQLHQILLLVLPSLSPPSHPRSEILSHALQQNNLKMFKTFLCEPQKNQTPIIPK